MTNLDTLSREMADLARAHQLGEKDIRARLERIHQDCTPETCECYRAGLTACVMHRCVSHRAVPRQNMSETGGAECGACILIEGDHEWALWAEKWTATIDTYSSLLAKAEARLKPMQARIAELERERGESDRRAADRLAEFAVIGLEARIAALEKALRQISEPDQEPLRDALRANDELRIIEAVTRALNWCRDVAKAALAESESASQPPLIQHAFVACYHGVGLCVTNPGPDGCHHGEPYCGQPRERHIQGQQSEREG